MSACVTKRIPSSLPVEKNRPYHINISSDQKRVMFGTAHGAVARFLPGQWDMKNPECFTYSGVKRPVLACSQSPNGRIIAAGDDNGTFYTWSWKSGELVMNSFNLDMTYVKINDISWSSDSRRVAFCGTDNYAKKVAMCVLVETGNTLGRLEGHEKGGCHSIHYRSKAPSRIATAGKDGQLLTHSGPPFKLAHKEPAHSGRAYCCRYAPDEETLVSCGEDGRLVFYEPVSGEKTSEVTICEGHPLFSLDWSPDGSMIAIAGNTGLIIFSHKTFKVVTHLECFNEACIGVQWSGNYWIAVAAISSHLHGFRLKTPTEFELEHENYLAEQANHLMLDIAEPEAESVATSTRAVSIEFCIEPTPSFTWTGPLGYPTSITVDPITKDLIMGTSKGSVLYIHNDSHSSHLVRLPNQKSVRSTVIGKDKEGVIATVDGIMRCFTYVWAPESETDPSLHAELVWTAQFNLGDSPVALLPIAEYTKLLAITHGGRMFCFDFKSIRDSTSADVLEYLWDVTVPGVVHSASVCEDGGLLVVALTARDPQGYVAARLTTTEAESALVETPESEGTPVAETISAGATPTTATSSGKDAGKLLKDTGKSVKDADKFIKAPYAIELFEINDASTSDGLHFIQSLCNHSAETCCVSLNPEGSLVASSDIRHGLHVVETATGRDVTGREWGSKHSLKVTNIAWTPDGNKLATSGPGRGIYVFDVDEPLKVIPIKHAHEKGTSAMAFVYNNVLVTAGNDGSISYYEVTHFSALNLVDDL